MVADDHQEAGPEILRRAVRALQLHIERQGTGRVAEVLGVDRTTVSRRIASQRLDSWSLADLVRLCRQDPERGGRTMFDSLARIIFPRDHDTLPAIDRHALVVLHELNRFLAELAGRTRDDGWDQEGMRELQVATGEAIVRLQDFAEHLRQAEEQLEA